MPIRGQSCKGGLARTEVLLALSSSLGAYVSVASLSVYFVIRMFPESLPRPPRFCMLDVAMILTYNGASAGLMALMVLLTLGLWRGQRRHGAASLDLVGLASSGFSPAALLLLLGIAAEVLQVVFIAGPAYRPLQALGQVCDVLAVMAVLGGVVVSVPPRTLLVDPRWSWRLALVVAVLPGLLASIGKAGYSEQVYLWLRVAAYPAAFALYWDSSARDGEPSTDSGMRSLVGVIFFVLAASSLHGTLLLTRGRRGLVTGANIITLGVVSANSLALLGVSLVRLVRGGRQGRTRRLMQSAGLLCLFSATIPAYNPPWLKHTLSLLLQLKVAVSQASVGLALLVALEVHGWLRRHDPAGGPPAVLRLTWVALGCGYLCSATISDWFWTHEIWVQQAQYVANVVLRLRITNSMVLAAALSLLMMVPAVQRSLVRLLATPPEPTELRP